MDQKDIQKMIQAMDEEAKGNTTFWTPEEGKNAIRILPPLKKKEEVVFFFSHKTHWIDGTPYECLNQNMTDKHDNIHTAEHCPACAMSKKLYRIGDENSEERELARQLNASSRYVYRIVVRGAEDETQPEFYETGPAIFKKLYNIIKDGEYGVIVDPIKGRDFIVDRQGTGRRTNYDASLPAAKESPIFSDKEKMKVLFQNAEKLDYYSLIEFASADELKKAVKRFLNPTSEETEEEKPAPKKKAASSDDFEESSDDQIDDILADFV